MLFRSPLERVDLGANGLVVAGIVIAIGVMFDLPVLTWIGVGIAVLSLIAGGVLRALGHGQPLR